MFYKLKSAVEKLTRCTKGPKHSLFTYVNTFNYAMSEMSDCNSQSNESVLSLHCSQGCYSRHYLEYSILIGQSHHPTVEYIPFNRITSTNHVDYFIGAT